MSLNVLPFPPLLLCSCLHSTGALTWAHSQFNLTYTHFSFPSLFIPIFPLFCGFEIPIRRILQTKFPRYSQCIKIESQISSFPLHLSKLERVRNTVCDLCRFRPHQWIFNFPKWNYRQRNHIILYCYTWDWFTFNVMKWYRFIVMDYHSVVKTNKLTEKFPRT
jgi:hypothetical protein